VQPQGRSICDNYSDRSDEADSHWIDLVFHSGFEHDHSDYIHGADPGGHLFFDRIYRFASELVGTYTNLKLSEQSLDSPSLQVQFGYFVGWVFDHIQ